MANVITINGVAVTANDNVVYNRNRKETADFGSMTIFSTRERRYEPYSRVVINSEQYLIESDSPLKLRSGQYEHKITLIENMAILSTVPPVNRQFTTVPSKTIKEILQIYQRELEFYQDFLFEFDETDTIYNETMVNKQYANVDFAVIVYDLFRKINAIPRLTWQNNKWYLSYELYTDRNSELTITAEARQSNVNDIDYATASLSKTRNALSESKGIWFPNKNATVTPRSKSTMLQTSDLQFELDSDINTIYQAIAVVPIGYTGLDEFSMPITKYVDLEIDITSGVRLKEDYDTLEISSTYPTVEILEDGETPQYKQNNIYYSIGSNTIEGLYWKKDGVLFTQNINALTNLINSCLEFSAVNNITDYEPNSGQIVDSDINNFECRFYYRPQRDVDFISEKLDITNFNKATVMNNQKDTTVELARHLENNMAFVNRIGNELIQIKASFDTVAEAWVLGDYYIENDEYWVITNIRYVLYKNLVEVFAEFTKNFSNINRETSITREPSAFVYTGKGIQSNFIYKEYLILYKDTTTRDDDSILTTTAKRIAMNVFDYNSTYNKPLTNMNYRRTGSFIYIDMPVYGEGGGNTIVMHSAFNDARVGGYGLRKINSAWYKMPIYYVDQNDYSLDSATVRLSNELNLKTDINAFKYYPWVDEVDNTYTSDLFLPFDKDINDTLAITYQLIIGVEDTDIIVPNGLAKFCNLIREFDDTPTLELYSNTEPYTMFDKKAKGTLISGNIDLYSTYIEVTDASFDPITYWAIAVDDEIILAGNNSIQQVKYIFTKNRSDYIIDTNLDIDFEYAISLGLEIVGSQQENYNISSDIELTLNSSVTFDVLVYIKNSVVSNAILSLDSVITYEIVEFETNDIQTIAQLTLNSVISWYEGQWTWASSDSTYYASASTKTQQLVDTAIEDYPTPSVEGEALKRTQYDLQSSTSGEYGLAGTQIDLTTTETITGASGTQTVESVFETEDATNYAIFAAGTMTDTVIKITDVSLNVTYWKPLYTITYHKAENNPR